MSLQSDANELRRELDTGQPRGELAEEIAGELALLRPDTQPRSRERAAYAAVGEEPPPTLRQLAEEEETATKRRTPSTKNARRQVRRAGRQTRRAATTLTRPRRTASVGGLILGTLALVLLYQFLTTADRAAGLFGGLARAVQWIDNPTTTIGGTPQ